MCGGPGTRTGLRVNAVYTDLVLDGAAQVGCVTREEDVLIGTFSRFAGTSHDTPIPVAPYYGLLGYRSGSDLWVVG